jgi:hypothetical protein
MKHEYLSLLGCDAVSKGKNFPTFRRTVTSRSSGLSSPILITDYSTQNIKALRFSETSLFTSRHGVTSQKT